ELNAYADTEITWNKLMFNPGVRVSYWANVYDKPHVEPRLSIAYRQHIHSVNFSVANMRQSMHLLSNNTAGVPIDLWVPAIREAPPMQSTIYAVGYARNTTQYLLQVGSCYKTSKNVIEIHEGKAFLGTQMEWNDKVV